MGIPKPIIYALIVIAALATIPPTVVLRARGAKSSQPRIHPIQDMDNQPKFKAQQVNPLFRDQRAMRPPVPGTVAQGEMHSNDHLYQGLVDGQWATTFPIPPLVVDDAFMRRGQQRFDIFCAPCHGLTGNGRGTIAVRAEELEEPKWVPPASLPDKQYRDRPDGHIFHTITYGIRTMPAYGSQIPVEDRWAIVAYVRALQLSRNARLEDLSPEDRAKLP
jgi:mono/diheme cytochrome c family protein